MRAEAAVTTPSRKRSQAESAANTPTPPAQPQQDESLADLQFDAETLKRARRAGMQSALVNLANRSEIRAHGFSGPTILAALKKHHGLVNAAKYSLLTDKPTVVAD